MPYNNIIGKNISIERIIRYKNSYKPLINLMKLKR